MREREREREGERGGGGGREREGERCERHAAVMGEAWRMGHTLDMSHTDVITLTFDT